MILHMYNNLTKSDICCLIISYNPDDNIFQLIKTLEHQVAYLIIVDNNSREDKRIALSEFIKSREVKLIINNTNRGVAAALNQGIHEAKLNKYKWIITFDQDTKSSNRIIEYICEVYNSYSQKERVGMIGVNYPDLNTRNFKKFSVEQKYLLKDYLITSGTLLNIQAFDEVGEFREDFFIDNVDLEYSLRLREHGKVLLVTSKIGMVHRPGNPKIKRRTWFSINSSNHVPFRRYFMARNHIILSRLYLLKFPVFIIKLNFFFILSFISMLFLEKDLKEKLLATLKGIHAGFKEKALM